MAEIEIRSLLNQVVRLSKLLHQLPSPAASMAVGQFFIPKDGELELSHQLLFLSTYSPKDIILKEDHPLDFNMSFAISLGLFPVKLSLETTGCGIKKSVLPVEEAGDLENGSKAFFMFSYPDNIGLSWRFKNMEKMGSSFLVAGLCKLHCFPPVELAWDATSGLHIFPNLYSETVMVDSSPALWSSTQGFEKTTVLLLIVNTLFIYLPSTHVIGLYEAWVIYNFLALCLAWVGGPGAVVLSLSGRVLKPSWYLMTCCFSPIPLDGRFIRRCKQGCLQFVILKPVLVAVTFILYAKGKYHDGNFSVDQSYLYLTVIYTVSYSVALYSLALFYVACRDLLQPFNPVPKFIIIKSVVFLTYWQSQYVILNSHCAPTSNTIISTFNHQYFSLCRPFYLLKASIKFIDDPTNGCHHHDNVLEPPSIISLFPLHLQS
ncbi:hypothetical protein CsSME_00030769 [Camellia sinensis var. sinensis]